MNANNLFFIHMAAEKVIAKLIASNMTEAQAADFVTVPANQVKILELAAKLHARALEIAAAK